jgi:hypothetical protein
MDGVLRLALCPASRDLENTMPRTLSLIATCALALCVCVCSPARGQDSPSLGDLARQAQKDREKEKASKPAAKVLTNDDLPSGPGGASGGLSGNLGQFVHPPADGKTAAAASPEERLAAMDAVLDKLESLDRTTLVRNALNGKVVDFPGRARWEERLLAAKQDYLVRGRDLVQKAREIVSSADGLKGKPDPNDPRVKELSAQLQALIGEAVRTDSALQAVVMEGRDLAAQADTSQEAPKK